MSGYAVSFAPLIAPWLLVLLAVLAAAICLYGVRRRARGALARLAAFAVVLSVLANPLIVHETRSPLGDVMALIVDRSQSMTINGRKAEAEAAAAKLRAALKRLDPSLEIRQVSVTTRDDGEDNGTQLFAALNGALADVPPDRIAGAIALTDGQVHDAPPADKFAFKAPLQVLIAGKRNEADRKLTVLNAARFAIVGKPAEIQLRVDDFGSPRAGGSARIAIRVDGKDRPAQLVPIGQTETIGVPIDHGGENVIELTAGPGPAELTLDNNRAVVAVSGVRDRLRVLLVSGEPNAGERVWRSLLKADPSVDLIHFTILRPPAKADMTPPDELSLIVFPIPELFEEKLSTFDLIIFDRFREQPELMPLHYLENVANYVENGGALLVEAGPEFAGGESIYRTPLASVLPARPTGEIVAQKFRPELTAAGQAHPVTHGLEGANANGKPAQWGSWFRLIGANTASGETVMSGPAGKPLLVLDHAGKGRVAELLSDQAWLWSRGYEGGGPEAELLRRLAHWLMKEPELEEERLTATVSGGEIVIDRHTMAKTAAPVNLTLPDNTHRALTLQQIEPGHWRATAKVTQLGLYRLSDGTLSAVAAAGPLNPKEVADMRATEAILKPLAEKSGGSVHWLADGLPALRMIAPGHASWGADWIGLRANGAYRVTAVEQAPLLPAWAGLLLIAITLSFAWWREGR